MVAPLDMLALRVARFPTALHPSMPLRRSAAVGVIGGGVAVWLVRLQGREALLLPLSLLHSAKAGGAAIPQPEAHFERMAGQIHDSE